MNVTTKQPSTTSRLLAFLKENYPERECVYCDGDVCISRARNFLAYAFSCRCDCRINMVHCWNVGRSNEVEVLDSQAAWLLPILKKIESEFSVELAVVLQSERPYFLTYGK